MGAIADINTELQTIAALMNVTYKRGRLEDLNPETVGVVYPVVWCFPFTNTANFSVNEILTKTVQVSLLFIDISETDLDRTATTDFTRIVDIENLADEFIYRFNQNQNFGLIENIAGAEFPLDNRYSHIVSTYSLTFNITLNTEVCYD